MNHNDWTTSDTMRAIAKILPADDPNNPRNLARAAAAAAAQKAAEAAVSQPAANPAANAPSAPSAEDNAAAEQAQQLAQQLQHLADKTERARARKRAKRRSRRNASPASQDETPLERHARLCTICDHDDREEIEADFVNWLSAYDIADTYDLDYHAVYRHARATGLFAKREHNLRGALGLIVERASTAHVTAGNVLRAIRAYSCLDRTGRWTEPPVYVVVSSGSQLAQSQSATGRRQRTYEVLPPVQEPASQPAGGTPERPSDG